MLSLLYTIPRSTSPCAPQFQNTSNHPKPSKVTQLRPSLVVLPLLVSGMLTIGVGSCCAIAVEDVALNEAVVAEAVMSAAI